MAGGVPISPWIKAPSCHPPSSSYSPTLVLWLNVSNKYTPYMCLCLRHIFLVFLLWKVLHTDWLQFIGWQRSVVTQTFPSPPFGASTSSTTAPDQMSREHLRGRTNFPLSCTDSLRNRKSRSANGAGMIPPRREGCSARRYLQKWTIPRRRRSQEWGMQPTGLTLSWSLRGRTQSCSWGAGVEERRKSNVD